ncbi:prepilin peptidase [Arcobacter sp. LA11]|uniref:prepilin peptidase n=1 Tax=Arcobacter sp. LA11 TaxID=1898176 RepID=UPI0009342C75|nr:prepilin peptidase [Arcobacter sp. LA11]
MFSISFYIFSFILSYIDCTKYKIPNILIVTLLLFLLSFGYLDSQLNLYSFIISFLILLFFVIILLIMPNMILGGGDIKYIMVVAIYLEPILFPLFLLTTGIVQMFFLIYFQKYKKRRVAPMAPAIFLAVIITEILYKMELYPY